MEQPLLNGCLRFQVDINTANPIKSNLRLPSPFNESSFCHAAPVSYKRNSLGSSLRKCLIFHTNVNKNRTWKRHLSLWDLWVLFNRQFQPTQQNKARTQNLPLYSCCTIVCIPPNLNKNYPPKSSLVNVQPSWWQPSFPSFRPFEGWNLIWFGHFFGTPPSGLTSPCQRIRSWWLKIWAVQINRMEGSKKTIAEYTFLFVLYLWFTYTCI